MLCLYLLLKKWIEAHDQSGGTNNTTKQIKCKRSMLRSGLCDYSDAYIAVKGIITILGENNMNRKIRYLMTL